MNKIVLAKDLEAWAEEQVAAGRAQSVVEVIEGALRERRALSDAHRALVEQAYESVDRGAVVEEAEAHKEFDRWIAEDSK